MGWKNHYLKLAYQGFNEIEIIRNISFKLENLNSLAPKLFLITQISNQYLKIP